MSISAVLLATIAAQVGVPAPVLQAVCWVESRHRNVINHVDGSSASYGPCQVKLATARMFNPRMHVSELLSPERNAYYAALYLRFHLLRYSGDVHSAIYAYNRGRAPQYCNHVRPCPQLINPYVKRVKRAMERKPWENPEHSNSPSRHKATSSSTGVQ